MIRLVFQTDYRWRTNSHSFLVGGGSRQLLCDYWWLVFYLKIFLRERYYKRGWSILVSPKCHKVGQRRYGIYRGYIIVDVWGNGLYREDWSVWCNYIATDFLILKRIEYRGRGCVKLVGLDGAKSPPVVVCIGIYMLSALFTYFFSNFLSCFFGSIGASNGFYNYRT